jgi:hypothetical protein
VTIDTPTGTVHDCAAPVALKVHVVTPLVVEQDGPEGTAPAADTPNKTQAMHPSALNLNRTDHNPPVRMIIPPA